MNRVARSRLVSIGSCSALFLLALAFRRPLGTWFSGKDPDLSAASGSGAVARASSSAGEIDHYTCSMHPTVKQMTPGQCPICGMTLVPVTKEQQAEGVVLIDQGRRQLIGVRTAPVIEGPLQSSFHALGRVAYDESALSDVTLKVRGFISQLLVNQTGQRVARGQTLLKLYSPELYNAEQDFLLATRNAGTSAGPMDAGGSRGASFAHAARKRLNLLGLSDTQLDAILAKGEPEENTAISSPASGFVIEKNVVEGAAVEPGMRLFRIAALNRVWIEADVYEADLARVRVGQHATITLDYLPGHRYEAKVSFVYPYLENGTRSGRVRFELANRELELRPGMYANVELASDLGSRVQVPASAIVYTGPRRLAFVDLGQGRFRPQELHLGARAGDYFEVLDGLKPGDIVATSGVFLIAAEARISTAAKYWDSDAPSAEAKPASEDAMPPPAAASAITRLPAPARAATSAVKPDVYSCPMHPSVQQAGPGKCPICGMDLVPSKPGATP